MPKRKRENSRLTAGEIEEIIELVPERLKPGVLDGSLIIRPQSMWWSEDKPVIVDADTKRLKHGRYATANDPALISKQSAYKRKRGYKEMQSIYIGAEPGETLEQITSLKEIIENLLDAANGSPQEVKVECPHPDICPYGGGKHVTTFAFKKDANAIFKLYENIVGKAAETSDVNINANHLVSLFNDRSLASDLVVIDLPPDQAYERKMLLEHNAD